MSGFDDELEDTTVEVPAAEDSALAGIRARRRARRAAQTIDLRVPGLGGVFVRFKPADQGKLVRAVQNAEKSKDEDAIALANAAVLIDACIGVGEIVDGKAVSVDPDDRGGEWPRFDERLGQILADEGELLERASAVCRALYDNDLAMSAVSDRLIEWSRTADEELDVEHSGN